MELKPVQPRRGETDVRLWARTATATAFVALAIAATAAALLVAGWRRASVGAVADPPALVQLKRDLKQDPANPRIKDKIRRADAEVRADFLHRQRQREAGRWVMFGALLVALGAGRVAMRLRTAKPLPGHSDTSGRAYLRQAWRAQDAVLVAIVAAGGACFFTAWHMGRAPLSAVSPTPGGRTMTGQVVADPATFARQWPRFRGPRGDGIAAVTNVQAVWDGPSSNGVAWSVTIPLGGQSSPIVWERFVFLTGADANRREVYGFDRRSGALLWRADVRVPGSDPVPPEVMSDTGYAAPTPATDGERVYAIFANGDLVALDFNGRTVWTLALGPLKNMYGHASSLVTWKNLLLVLLDQGAAEDGQSRLLALDGATGKPVWSVGRPVANSWTTPVVGGPPEKPQVFVSANPWVAGYDAVSGVERWRTECLSGDVAPSPVWSEGTVYAVNAGAALAAIRTDGTGTVTETHIRWKAEDNLPDTCSPLCTGPRIYLLTSSGLLTCHDAASGQKLWEHEIGGMCQASPTLVGGRILVLTTAGTAVWVADAPVYREIRRSELGDQGCAASPAVVDGAILLRSATRLWCVGR